MCKGRNLLMKTWYSAGAALCMTVLPALAQDAAVGEAAFTQCRACHAIVADDGTVIVKGGRTGPNLFGLLGRAVGSREGFAYGDALRSVGEAGIVWDEAELAAYIANPGEWLRAKTGDARARSRMGYRMTEGAADMAAYLAGLK